jgi:triosephosphate isomerase
MVKPLVAGNWKMNGSRDAVDTLVAEVAAGLAADRAIDCEVLVCPPSVYLERTIAACGEAIAVGAQNAEWRDAGAFTGEIALDMIRDCGARYVLVGHSERREYYGETDEVVASKMAACISKGLRPILCVGEKLVERTAGQARAVIERQVAAVADRLGDVLFAQADIAYEPVWAIGTGETASPQQANEAHGWIRNLAGSAASDLRILYGGSVNAGNAAELLQEDNLDGALVGGASLKSAGFLTICKAASGA